MFLPVDYKAPVSEGNGRYLKFPDGETVRFRVLSSAVVGYEYWNNQGKPVRLRQSPSSLPIDIRIDDSGKPERIRHFWAFVAFDYKDGQTKICEITQKTIMSAILALVKDSDYGDPKGYDLKITRKGKGLETEYSVVPTPPKLFDNQKAIEEAKTINLESLFDGLNPFESLQQTTDQDSTLDEIDF